MKKLLAIILAVVMVLSLAACGGGGAEPTKKPETYPKLLGKLHEGTGWVINELYLWNTHMERKVYTYEILPDTFDVNGGKKLPVIIYAHGGKGNADSLVSEPKLLAADGIAGFTFEACGASAVAPKSGEGSASSSSRASDMYAVLQYVKTLPWVDTSKIFIYGQSAGGQAVMYLAPKLNGQIAGMIIESSGFIASEELQALYPNDRTPMGTNPDEKVSVQEGDVAEFMPTADQTVKDYILSYTGDVIICCSVDGENDDHRRGQQTEIYYNERTTGKATFYSCPGGAHGFNSFSEEGQQITIEAMRKFVLGE